MLPLARLAARRHGRPLVDTMHLSVRSCGGTGAAVERRLLPGADPVIALTCAVPKPRAGSDLLLYARRSC